MAYTSYAQPQRFSFTEPKMGSPFTIILYAGDSAQAAATAGACFLLVDSLVNIFSDYIDSSELNRLCATAGTGIAFPLSPALYDILIKSREAYTLSQGSFDISLGPLSRLWRQARKENRWPSDEQVREKRAQTGFHNILLDSGKQTATLLVRHMKLDLGGIAQGYIAQQVIERIRSMGLQNALVNVSGDIVAMGSPPGKAGWTVAVNTPRSGEELLPEHFTIKDKAVTTSGDVYQYMIHKGKRYSHVIDPKTGYGLTNSRNVTVIAGDGTTADWLTKAVSLLPLESSRKLASRLNAEFLIAEIRNGKMVYETSAGLKKFTKTFAQN